MRSVRAMGTVRRLSALLRPPKNRHFVVESAEGSRCGDCILSPCRQGKGGLRLLEAPNYILLHHNMDPFAGDEYEDGKCSYLLMQNGINASTAL